MSHKAVAKTSYICTLPAIVTNRLDLLSSKVLFSYLLERSTNTDVLFVGWLHVVCCLFYAIFCHICNTVLLPLHWVSLSKLLLACVAGGIVGFSARLRRSFVAASPLAVAASPLACAR